MKKITFKGTILKKVNKKACKGIHKKQKLKLPQLFVSQLLQAKTYPYINPHQPTKQNRV